VCPCGLGYIVLGEGSMAMWQLIVSTHTLRLQACSTAGRITPRREAVLGTAAGCWKAHPVTKQCLACINARVPLGCACAGTIQGLGQSQVSNGSPQVC